jgi:hypothetical protein
LSRYDKTASAYSLAKLIISKPVSFSKLLKKTAMSIYRTYFLFFYETVYYFNWIWKFIFVLTSIQALCLYVKQVHRLIVTDFLPILKEAVELVSASMVVEAARTPLAQAAADQLGRV